MFLGAIKNDTRYTKQTTLDIYNVLPKDINAAVPHEYRLGHIVETICNHASVEKGVGLDAYYEEATQPHIKSTEALYDDTGAAIYRVNEKDKHPKRPCVQCLACNTYGNEDKTCDYLAKLCWTAKYMKDNLDETVKVAEAFKQKHTSSTKATVHALMTEMELFDKSNFRSEQHA